MLLAGMSREAFYATAAQVIPLLWIVMVFQLKVFGDKVLKHGAASVQPEDQHRRAPTWFLIFIVVQGVLMFLAELDCLYSLVGEEDTAGSRAVIMVALIGAVTMVFYTPVAPWFEALVDRLRRHERS